MSDLISRQAIKNMITNHWSDFSNETNYRTALACVDAVPTVTPSQPEIIYCKDCKKQNKHYHESPYKDTVCPLTAWRGKAQGHEYDYQYCCFAERREVTE